MLAKKRNPLIFIINIALFFVVILFHTSEIIDISIKNATPMLLLPLITAFSLFSPMGSALAAGFISGALIDSIAQSSYCFNTVVLILIAVTVNLIANNLFNKNLFSAVVLCLMTCGVYYLLIWIFFHLVGRSVEDSLGYLLSYALPSALYSAVFILPFYCLYKFLKN